MSESGSTLRPLLLLREAAIIVAVAFGAYIYISLGSFQLSDSEVSGGQIENIGGQLGVKLAYGFFYVFGNSAYLAVAVIICSVWLIFGQIARGRTRFWALSAITGLLLLLVCSSALEALHFAAGETLPGNRTGGILGFSVAKSLHHLLGFHGATLILAGCWLAGASLFANFSWLEACDLAGLASEKIYAKLKPVFKLLFRMFFTEAPAAIAHSTPKAAPAVTVSDAAAKSVQKQPKQTGKSKSIMQDDHEPDFGNAKVAAVKPAVVHEKEPVGEQASTQAGHTSVTSTRTAKRSRGKKPKMSAADLLSPITSNARRMSDDELQVMAESISNKLEEFGVVAVVREILPGPVVTRYEIEPAKGVKGSQVVNLARDLSRALGVGSIRVLESIPGKTTMGLEVPNQQREMVSLQDVIGSKEFVSATGELNLALGKDIAGQPVIADLDRMPHLLAAGTTGSGKSVQVNSIILSLLFKYSPDEVRLILVDPKVVEMGVYDGLPHLFSPSVTNMDLVPAVLSWCVGEMEMRYKLMATHGVRNIGGLNALAEKGTVVDESGEPLAALPRLVVIIDELADLMMVSGKKVEQLISRLAQKARAAGIHLILATQRPSVNVITGLIKANIPSRIAFQVSSKIDSRTILDQGGAETLLGLGDMLYLPGGIAEPIRVHGAFVSDQDVHKVVAYIKQQYADNEYAQIDFSSPQIAADEQAEGANGEQADDEMFDQAVEVVRKRKRASISLVQRELRIGYNRAARIVDQMERKGIVSAMDESGARTLLDQ